MSRFKVLSSKLEDAYMLRDRYELLAVRHVKVLSSRLGDAYLREKLLMFGGQIPNDGATFKHTSVSSTMVNCSTPLDAI